MKIGVDIDGVVTEIPDIVRSICNSGNHEIYIITYRDNKDGVSELLKAYNIYYDEIFTCPSGREMVEWKRSIAINLNIDAMIEDTPEILNSLPSNIKRIWICDPSIYNLQDAIDGMVQKL